MPQVAVLVDDMIDTAGTITNAAKVLHAEGAREVYACATHAVFSPPAVERLSSGVFQEVIVANTVPVPPEHQFAELTVLSGEWGRGAGGGVGVGLRREGVGAGFFYGVLHPSPAQRNPALTFPVRSLCL